MSESIQPHFWARLKPQDPGRGHLLGGLFVSCFGPTGGLAEGGDGISKIPVWYRVTPEQATKLRLYKQTGERGAPDAFDIVGDEDRAQIDRGEEMNRKIALGLVPKPVDVSDQHLRAHERNMTPEAEAPAVAPEPPTATPAPAPIAPAGSRTAALAGLDRWKKTEVEAPELDDDGNEDSPPTERLPLEPLPAEDGHDLAPPPPPLPTELLQPISGNRPLEPQLQPPPQPATLIVAPVVVAPPPAGPPPMAPPPMAPPPETLAGQRKHKKGKR